MRPTKANFAPYKTSVIEMLGGINENDSSLALKGGELIDCKNYIMAPGTSGGYKSISGYERYDGQGVASEAIATVLQVIGLSEEVVGSPSELSIYGNPLLVSGTYGDDAIVEMELVDPSALVEKGDTLTWGLVEGTISLILENYTATDNHHETLEAVRATIQEVPGELQVLGLNIFEGEMYAFRKKVGLSTVGMYKEDATSGWVEIDTSTNPLVYGSNDFEFRNFNFSANVDEFSMYWVDGVNKARAFDGTTVTVVDNAGMDPNDKPKHINIHANLYLALGYEGGSLQLSTIGAPLDWTTAPFEFGMGSPLVEVVDGKEDSSVIFMEKGIRLLTGNTEATFQITTVDDDSNPRMASIRELLGTLVYIDDTGMTTLSATDTYGNYGATSISKNFKKTLDDPTHNVVTSCVSRDLTQYRLFFDDRSALCVSFDSEGVKGATILEYDRDVWRTCSGKTQGGTKGEVYFIDGTSGYIFKMDSGTSFDGVAIITRLSTAFYHYNTPRQLKTFKRCTMEVNGESGQLFSVKTEFDYNEGENGPSIWYDKELYKKDGTATWGVSRWGTMVWGTAKAATNRLYVYIAGQSTNLSYKFLSNEAYRQPHVLQDIITDFTINSRRI